MKIKKTKYGKIILSLANELYENEVIDMFEQFVGGKIGKVDLKRDGRMIKKIGKEIDNQKILMELEK